MSTTLDFQPADLARAEGHYIGGRHVGAAETLEVLRPCDGQPLGRIALADESTVDFAVQDARRAWTASGWGHSAPRERARVLNRWADLIDRHAVELGQLEAAASTRPVSEAVHGDVPFTAEAIRFFAELADKVGGDVAATRQDSLGMIVPEPYGVVAAIAPWNFPLSMASWKCGPALAAGNAVVLKPSELTPYSTLRLAELAVEAGLPEGVFNVINGRGPQAGGALARHPLVGKISFTGSTRTGGAIMSEAGRHGARPMTLELGGKSPQLVFEDVPDLAHVARCVARGFTANGGQACVAGTRLIVHRRLARDLVEAVLAELQSIAPGPTWVAATAYSPIISSAQADRIARIVHDAQAQGARLLTGGARFADHPAFYRPTVLDGVRPGMDVLREEVFGPVLTVQTFETEAEGLALADHPVYGLAAGVHTRDIGQALRAARRLEAGTVWINRYGRSGDMIMPTGGFKGSGIGKDLGRQAMEASLRYKSVLVDFDAA
ncbi:aldehyde dehydrogenase family protein [Bordetella hinzii]|uniref:aldehyde dehydrogenase family protein n=1 Tax=Bordetella hinzii TaxID=103855 RepID=UPI001C00945B|nr:aldehyde dehydrogenase family protein [Bordetella hinzii]QWF40184.1 aldehyde dehydrogenase family protein [Bordetella hinzii]QWF44731.1 aldehyde dehydrogenase family protein [Bordetella hinzii]QWF49268.1 aldehyde dehydrogenase family protein [Bordetella hinzii]QWF53804.1 aldehyde dehydrogenase family protein [Bordetella hinzii]QWF58294.1 aldehyde dehydrogenase family protein [Bordetella hinzii]